MLSNDWNNGASYQRYGFEYTPGTGSDGETSLLVGHNVSFAMNGDAIGPNGNINSRVISEEPMAVVLNIDISPAWTGITFSDVIFPMTMYVDYVR